MNTDFLYKAYFYIDLKRRFPQIRNKLKILEEEQHKDYELLRNQQLKRIKRLLFHAFENCPYYHESFLKVGIDVKAIKTWDDFSKIPILKKKDIQNHLNDFLAKSTEKNTLFKDATGGSTGEPLIFYHDHLCKEWFEACNIFVNSWWGIKPWHKKAFLWGADRDIPDLTIKQWLKQKLSRSTLLNSFDMDENKMQNYAYHLKKDRPQYIQGYASSLYIFSKYLNQNGISIPPPMAIRSSADTLTPEKRKIINQVLGNNLFDFYGSREVTNIAAECPSHNGLHIFSPIRYVEVVDAENKNITGKPGRVVVTDLMNYSMPFIRYEIGDVGVISEEPCACGRSFPKLKRIEGRTTDFIQTCDGKYIHGEYFTHLFYGIEEVSDFQVHQKNLRTLNVYIVESKKMPQATVEHLKENIHNKMGKEVTIYFKSVDKIPLAKSGKQRFTISDVPPQFS